MANQPKIVIKQVSELKAYENNPRINDEAVEAVANSIKEFGFKNPVIIDINNVVVCGHTRLKACEKLGIVEVPCIVADDLTEDQIKAFRLADNKTAEIAQWDFKKLAEELKIIDLDMDQFGFADLRDKLEEKIEEDEINEEDINAETYCQTGDYFLLGKHRLLVGDSTKEEDVKRLVDGKKIDLLFVDCPYNVDYEGQNGMKIQNDKQSSQNFYNFLLKIFTNAYNVCKPGATAYSCQPDCEELNFCLALRDSGWNLSQFVIWVKDSFVFGRKDYHCRHEMLAVARKEGAAHYFIDDRTQDSIWEYPKPKSNDLHPTMKPVPLVARAIKNSCRHGESVIDLCAGSGTTLVAAEQEGRIAYCMEIDTKYADVIVKRYLRLVNKYDDCFLVRDGVKTPLSEIEAYKVLDEDSFLN